MIGFMRYQWISYVRSLKFIPPATVFCAWVFILYAYSGVPILSSYAVTSIAIYLVMTWVAMTIFSIDGENEKYIIYVQLDSKKRYLWGKWAICFIYAFLFMLFAILYPILMNNFKGTVEPIHIGLSISGHFFSAWFGILVGTFFSITSFSARKYSWLSALLVVIISIAYEGLVEKVSLLKWGLILFPPVTEVNAYMNRGDFVQINTDFYLLAAWGIMYGVLGSIFVMIMYMRKEQ